MRRIGPPRYRFSGTAVRAWRRLSASAGSNLPNCRKRFPARFAGWSYDAPRRLTNRAANERRWSSGKMISPKPRSNNVTALGKLLRTTAFKLTLVYLGIFVLFAATLLAYFALNTRRLITEQITATVNGEVSGLSEQYGQGGLRRLVIVVDVRSRRPGSSLYLVTTPSGEGLAGNVGSLEPGVLDHPGWLETNYHRLESPEGAEHRALVRVVQLPGGFRLLVGRDLEERERLFGIVVNAGQWSLALVIVLGLLGGFFVSRRILSRIDAMTGTAQTIMAGDLSGRLPVAGTGDELDRLAHDLKTPLTRLRNRCEQALRSATGEASYRAALDATIAESDDLIRTFDALLMIARAESGQARENMTEFDASEIARDVGELYEPVADEKGIALKIDAPEAAPVRGNRELVSQALANLIDNAIKYAGPNGKVNGVPAEIVVRAGDDGERITLSVADRGPGIPDADRGRVVERFVRLEQSRSEPGSGLGLSLASAVARLHGGELKLEDNHPGLRTTIALPRAGPGAASAGRG